MKDLFDHDPCIRRHVPEAVKILFGITEPVRMVDADPVKQTVSQPLKDKAMGFGKHGFIFDPQRGQFVDGKKPAIVQVFGRGAPVSQAVMLGAEEPVQGVDICIDLRHHRIGGGPAQKGRTRLGRSGNRWS